jgi:hypothetical protein
MRCNNVRAYLERMALVSAYPPAVGGAVSGVEVGLLHELVAALGVFGDELVELLEGDATEAVVGEL